MSESATSIRPSIPNIKSTFPLKPVKFYLPENLNDYFTMNIDKRKHKHSIDLIIELNKTHFFSEMRVNYFYRKSNGVQLNTIDEIIMAKEVICSYSSIYKLPNASFSAVSNSRIKVDHVTINKEVEAKLADYRKTEASNCTKIRFNFYKEFRAANNLHVIEGINILTKTFDEIIIYLESLGISKRPFDIYNIEGKKVTSVEDIIKSKNSFTIKPRVIFHTIKEDLWKKDQNCNDLSVSSEKIVKRSKSAPLAACLNASYVHIPNEKDYEILQYIESGCMSKVYKAVIKSTSEIIALKIIDPIWKIKKPELIKREINIMSSLSCPNIVRFVDTFENKNGIYIVQEYAPYGDCYNLMDKRGRLTEPLTANIVKQLSLALIYLQSLSIIHRDIKLENLLIFDDSDETLKVKLADFGLAISSNITRSLKDKCGTPYYVAPEMLEGTGYGSEIDNYAVGVVAYICLAGYFPYTKDNEQDSDQIIYDKILKGDLKFKDEYWKYSSIEAKKLIKDLLKKNPRTRLTALGMSKNAWVEGKIRNS